MENLGPVKSPKEPREGSSSWQLSSSESLVCFGFLGVCYGFSEALGTAVLQYYKLWTLGVTWGVSNTMKFHKL